MLKEFPYPIRVSSKIKTILRKDRLVPELKIGNKYYVSFGTNCAYPCFLVEIINQFERTEIKIKIQVEDDLAYFRRDGKLIYEPFQMHILYANEIGSTPENAIRNAV